MLESSSNWLTREWIKRAVINQYECQESETSAAGIKVMIATHGNGRNTSLHTRCPICSRTGHVAQECREYRITKRESEPKGMRHDGDAGTRGSGNHRGGGGINQKYRNAKNGDSESKTDRSRCCFCQGPHKPPECPNRSSAAAPPTANNSQHGVFLVAHETTSAWVHSRALAQACHWPRNSPNTRFTDDTAAPPRI